MSSSGYEALIKSIAGRLTRDKHKYEDLCQVGRLEVFNLGSDPNVPTEYEARHKYFMFSIRSRMVKAAWDHRVLRLSKTTYERLKSANQYFKLQQQDFDDPIDPRPSASDVHDFWDTVRATCGGDERKVLVLQLFLVGYRVAEIGEIVGMKPKEVEALCAKVARVFKYAE